MYVLQVAGAAGKRYYLSSKSSLARISGEEQIYYCQSKWLKQEPCFQLNVGKMIKRGKAIKLYSSRETILC